VDQLSFPLRLFLKGNLFLRGAVCWCSLLDSLMCVGEANHNRDGEGIPFRLQHPVDFLNVSDDHRNRQISGACRVLQELVDTNCFDNFMEGLCTHNPRYNCEHTNQVIFAFTSKDSHESFACYKSREQTVEQLMQKESKLQVREAELQEKVAQFEFSKAEQQSIIERENKVRTREIELLQSERAYALKVQQLERMNEDLWQKRSHLDSGQNESCGASPTHPISIMRRDRNADHTRSNESSELKAPAIPAKMNGSRRRDSDRPTPNQSQRCSHVLAGNTQQESKRRQSTSHGNPNPSQKYSERLCEKLDDKPLTSSKNAIGHGQKKETDLRPSYLGHSDTDSECQTEDLHKQSQESNESTSSRNRRKRESRKSPKCSLHNLPASNTQQSRSPQQRPPRSPKKVFINLGED